MRAVNGPLPTQVSWGPRVTTQAQLALGAGPPPLSYFGGIQFVAFIYCSLLRKRIKFVETDKNTHTHTHALPTDTSGGKPNCSLFLLINPHSERIKWSSFSTLFWYQES